MKSQRVVKEIIKSEKLPQGQTRVLSGRRSKNGVTSNVYTVKETTLEKRIKRSSYGTEGSVNKSEQNISSNLKQGTNSGFIAQNKIPVSNKEENKFIIYKSTRSTRSNISEGYQSRRYSKKEIEKIIKIQRWWRRILPILDGYKIRESQKINNKNYVVKSQKVYTERYVSNVSSQSSNRTSNLNGNMNVNSKSYSNINNINTNIKRNLNPNVNINSSSSQNYIQTIDKRVIRQSSPKAVSDSTSPSVKSKYIIETKKVEVFRKPKNYSENKFVKETNVNTSSSISNYEVKQLMRGIWSNETYCSPVESLCCLADDGKSNISQNTVLFEEYEEEIRKLKSVIMKKDDELNNLMTNLKETKNKLNISITKNMKMKNGYNQKILDQDAHELQIISTKLGWNDVNIPSPVNEMFIESIENKMPQRMQYIEGMQIMGKKQEESVQESISDPEAVLEIQEMNALSIISNKRKSKSICQHLQSLMILSTRKEEQIEEYSIKEKEEKNNIEIIPVEKEPLIFQKIEQINYKSRPKPRKAKNQIQELDGLEIINYKRPKLDLKRKTKIKLSTQNIDKICLKSMKKIEKNNAIQELDGLQILKAGKKPNVAQCVDELEIEREYDMLLVKPTWNSLQIQGSGLNLLAIPRDMGLENQEVDEFEILGMEKPALYIESLEKISYEKPKSLQKIQVLIPLPQNNIEKLDNFKIYGTKKAPQIKIVEKEVQRKAGPNKIVNSGKLLIKGKAKIIKEKILKLDTFFIKGKEKLENKKVVKPGSFKIKGKEKVVKNTITKQDKFIIKRKDKIDNNQIINSEMIEKKGKEKKEFKNKIIKNDKIEYKGKEMKKVGQNRIMKNEKIEYRGKGKKKVVPNKIIKNEKIEYKGKGKKTVKNKIFRNDKIQINGLEIEEKEKEENIEESVIELSIIKKQKKIVPNKIKELERFRIKGMDKPKEIEKEIENIESLRISKAYSTKQEIHEFNNLRIGKRFVINLKGQKKVIQKQEVIQSKPQIVEKIVEKIIEKDWNDIIKKCTASKLFIKKDYEKVKLPEEKKIIEKEEIVTEEKVYKNWNDEIRPIKTTKLNVKGIEKKVVVEKEKEEFDIESFALNISDSGKKFRESLHIENSGFDLEGNKGMILKEGPAQTIQITKEQILIPSRVTQFNLISKIKKIEKIEKVEKIEKKEVKEVKKPKLVLKSVKENKLFIKGIKQKQVQQEIKERIKTVEKIVEVERKVDWNKTNEIENKGRINLLKKKKTKLSAKQRTNSISLIGSGVQKVQKIVEKKETVVRDWSNLLHAQRNAKFALIGKTRIKKYNLLVANGDKFFIQKESEDEIIYNDDYNTRKDKQKLRDENEKKRQIIKEREIIKEKEYVPRLQREIRAQISRLKESESSETSSSIGEIDVLAAIKGQKMMGYSAAGEADTGLLGYKKTGEYNGYQTKVISGEVVFTAKNGLGVNLGGAEYQKRIKGNLGYTKKISNISSNKISGIEIVNPNVKSEINYQKMSGASGAIADGHYKIIGTKQVINDKGLTGSVSCRQMKVITNNKNININSPELDIGNNGQVQSYKKQIVITSKSENTQNEINGSPNSNVILNSRTVTSGNMNIKKRGSQNSGNNNSRIKDSPNSGNNIRINDSQNSTNNNYSVNQMKRKVIINQNSQNVGTGQNKTITTTRQYQMKIKTNEDKNEKVITETKKTTEIKMKKK